MFSAMVKVVEIGLLSVLDLGHLRFSVHPNHKHVSLRHNMDVHSVPSEHSWNNTEGQWTVLA